MQKRGGLVLAVVLVAAAGAAAQGRATVTPEEAIAVLVRQHFGAAAQVTVEGLATTVAAESGLVARPDATARVGKRSRFLLTAGGAHRGSAVATVAVRAVYPRAARDIARDEAIDASAIDLSEGTLPQVRIEAMPGRAVLAGQVARRNIAAGEPLVATVLRTPAVVRTGDTVDATIRVGLVEVTGTGIASGSGEVGDLIRVMQPHSSRLLKARIVGPGAVEIVE